MMHTRTPLRVLGAAAAVVVLSAFSAGRADAQRTYSSLTMFGDSFSDVGNAALLAPGIPLRFSNGPVWSDVLANALGRPGDATPAFATARVTGVYAIGGAITNPASPTGTFAQIGRWCLAVGGVCTRTADPTGLYTLFAGGNDVRSAAGLATDAARQAATVTAANNLINQAGGLLGTGARSILFSYLPDLGLTPDRIGGPQSATLTQLTKLFNQTLETGIAGLRLAAPSTTSLFDLRLDNLFANLLASPASYGFNNTNGSCIAAGQLPACTGYVFWDGLHPSSASHAFVGAAAYNLVANGVNVSLVPEPATVVLTGTGLLALGGLVRRRRRAA